MIKHGGRPIHPGEDYLAPLDMSANTLVAKVLHVTQSRINEILQGQHGITADTAMRLARCFDTTSQIERDIIPRSPAT